MCSPFSTTFWQKSLESYQSIGSTQSESHQEAAEKMSSNFRSTKDSESFRNFTSQREILSETWRGRIAERLPLDVDRR